MKTYSSSVGRHMNYYLMEEAKSSVNHTMKGISWYFIIPGFVSDPEGRKTVASGF